MTPLTPQKTVECISYSKKQKRKATAKPTASALNKRQHLPLGRIRIAAWHFCWRFMDAQVQRFFKHYPPPPLLTRFTSIFSLLTFPLTKIFHTTKVKLNPSSSHLQTFYLPVHLVHSPFKHFTTSRYYRPLPLETTAACWGLHPTAPRLRNEQTNKQTNKQTNSRRGPLSGSGFGNKWLGLGSA